MRSYRALSALLATLVAGVLTVALVSFVPSAQAAQKPRHDTSSVVANKTARGGKFYVKGTLKTYKRKVVVLQSNKPGPSGWKRYKGERTNQRGYFYIKFDGRVGTKFRIIINKTSTHRRTTKVIGQICREPC